MNALQLRLALAARCATTKTHYGGRGASGSFLVREPLPLALLPERCGVYPIAPGDDKTALAVLDLDNHGKPPLPWEQVAAAALPLVEHLRLLGHHPLPFRSTGGHGLHLWLVWDKPQQAAAVRAMLLDTLELSGLTSGSKGLAEGQVEVFPKQDAVPADGWGAAIDLPLAGQSCPLDPATLLPVDVVPLLVTSKPLSKKKLAAKKTEVDEVAWHEATVLSALAAIPADEYEDWVNVLRALLGGATRAGVDARAIAEEWSKTSEKHNSREFAQKWDRGFPKERTGQGRSLGTLYWLAKKKFGWQPPAPPCCIVKIRVQESSPKLYLVTIAGHEGEEVPMRSDALASKQAFIHRVLEHLDYFVVPPKQAELNKLLATAERIETDAAATTIGQFKANLLAYLDESLSQEKEELRLQYRSWRDATAGRTYFKWASLDAWLKRQRRYDVHHTEAYHMIKQMEGGKARLDLGRYGKVSVWFVPMDPRENAPEPEAAKLAPEAVTPF